MEPMRALALTPLKWKNVFLMGWREARNTLRKLLVPPAQTDDCTGHLLKPPARRHNKTLMQPEVPSAGKACLSHKPIAA